MDFELKDQYAIQDLVKLVQVLRGPNGCPWDKEQTHMSIRKNLIEETYEVAEAIDNDDAELLREELGDLLLQVLLHAEIEREVGVFSFDDVCDGLCKKLIFRHPHVFGDIPASDTTEALRNWEELKNREKGRSTVADRLQSVPAGLPALMKCQKVQKRAADFGHKNENIDDALRNLDLGVGALKQALQNGEGTEKAMGDALFSLVSVAQCTTNDAEEALTGATERFTKSVLQAEKKAQK